MSQIWRQRCCATGDKIGTGCVFAMTRWDKSRKPAVENLVLFNSAAMADRFDEEVRGGRRRVGSIGAAGAA